MQVPPNKGVVIDVPKGATHEYAWGDKALIFHNCKTCGCVTHWSGAHNDRFAVNFRLIAPRDYAGIPIQRFDGAEGAEFLD